MSYSFFINLKCAINGIWHIISTERHFQVHLIFAFIVTLFGYFFQITITEWFYLSLTVIFVLFAELNNTIIEYIVNQISPHHSQFAKHAKDMGAAAVLITVIHSLIAGYLLFFERIAKLFIGG